MSCNIDTWKTKELSDQLNTHAAAERELELIVESIERYEQAEPGTVDADEYDKLLDRYHKLRSQGYGPQPYEVIA